MIEGTSRPAFAAGCIDGDRGTAAFLANNGWFFVPYGVAPYGIVYSDQAKIELRYATNGSRCAWGLISNAAPHSAIWLDRSHDGGRTWETGQMGIQYVGNWSHDQYTGVYNDAGVVVRACGFAYHPGPWWWTNGYSYGPTRCTAWY
jgi:hypothetical protein